MGKNQDSAGGSYAGDELLATTGVLVQGERMSGLLAEKNSTFKYTPGGNVQATWRKYGWVPPSEYREDYLFKIHRDFQGEENERTN